MTATYTYGLDNDLDLPARYETPWKAEVEALVEAGASSPEGPLYGFFLRLPEPFSTMFPRVRGDDDSPPHVTLYNLGATTVYGSQDESRVLAALVEVAAEVAAHFAVRMLEFAPGVSWFTAPAQPDTDPPEPAQEIASKRFTEDAARWLGEIHAKLRAACAERGIVGRARYLGFKDHSTLAYLPAGDRTFLGAVPEGQFEAAHLEVWSEGRTVVAAPFVPPTYLIDEAVLSELHIEQEEAGEERHVFSEAGQEGLGETLVVDLSNVDIEAGEQILFHEDGVVRAGPVRKGMVAPNEAFTFPIPEVMSFGRHPVPAGWAAPTAPVETKFDEREAREMEHTLHALVQKSTNEVHFRSQLQATLMEKNYEGPIQRALQRTGLEFFRSSLRLGGGQVVPATTAEREGRSERGERDEVLGKGELLNPSGAKGWGSAGSEEKPAERWYVANSDGNPDDADPNMVKTGSGGGGGGEARGGTYHRRVPVVAPDGTVRQRYYYSEEAYLARPDAHVSGMDAERQYVFRRVRELLDARDGGVALSDPRFRELAVKYGPKTVGSALLACGVVLEGSRIKRLVKGASVLVKGEGGISDKVGEVKDIGGGFGPRSLPPGTQRVWNGKIVEKRDDGRWHTVGRVSDNAKNAVPDLSPALLTPNVVRDLINQIKQVKQGTPETEEARRKKEETAAGRGGEAPVEHAPPSEEKDTGKDSGKPGEAEGGEQEEGVAEDDAGA